MFFFWAKRQQEQEERRWAFKRDNLTFQIETLNQTKFDLRKEIEKCKSFFGDVFFIFYYCPDIIHRTSGIYGGNSVKFSIGHMVLDFLTRRNEELFYILFNVPVNKKSKK